MFFLYFLLFGADVGVSICTGMECFTAQLQLKTEKELKECYLNKLMNTI